MDVREFVYIVLGWKSVPARELHTSMLVNYDRLIECIAPTVPCW
jgi:hypothetical protein